MWARSQPALGAREILHATIPLLSKALLSKLDRSVREEGDFHWVKRVVFRFSQTTPPKSVQIKSKKNQIGLADLERREVRTGRLTNPIDLGRPTGSSVGSTSSWKRTSCNAPSFGDSGSATWR